MKKRRILTILTAAAMTLAMSATAFAADTPVTSTGDTTISGSGDVEYDAMANVYSVTLPTANALNFTLDPQGLASLENGQEEDLETLLAKGGDVVTADTAGAYIRNESSVGVKVTVKAKITDTNDAGKLVTPVTTYDDVTKDDNTNICLVAVPGTAAKPADISGHVDAEKGIVIENVGTAGGTGGTTTDFTYVLGKADYVVKKDASGTVSLERKAGTDNYDAATFKLTGKVNTKAKWGDYVGASAKSIGIEAVFSVADATDTDTAGTQGYGLMNYAGTMVNIPVKDKAPSVTGGTDITVTADTAFNVTVDFGKGDLAATGITKVVNPAIPDFNLVGTDFASVNGNTIAFTAATANYILDNNLDSLDIVFNDSAATTIPLNFQ